MSSLFDPHLYHQYRIKYPLQLFAALNNPIRQLLGASKRGEIYILDLGAGSGLSSDSFLEYLLQTHGDQYSGLLDQWLFHLVDPHAELLDYAARNISKKTKQYSIFCEPAEKLNSLNTSTYDLALIGSAWHWMDSNLVKNELERVLCKCGYLYVFEYQFPKEVFIHTPLNNWVRRQFNENWKAPRQKPRGSLAELLSEFHASSKWVPLKTIKCFETVTWDIDTFAGHLFSQSRYLHYLENKVCEGYTRDEVFAKTLSELKPFFAASKGDEQKLNFKFTYEGFLFQLK